jgi:hypothetical protein
MFTNTLTSVLWRTVRQAEQINIDHRLFVFCMQTERSLVLSWSCPLNPCLFIHISMVSLYIYKCVCINVGYVNLCCVVLPQFPLTYKVLGTYTNGSHMFETLPPKLYKVGILFTFLTLTQIRERKGGKRYERNKKKGREGWSYEINVVPSKSNSLFHQHILQSGVCEHSDNISRSTKENAPTTSAITASVKKASYVQLVLYRHLYNLFVSHLVDKVHGQ